MRAKNGKSRMRLIKHLLWKLTRTEYWTTIINNKFQEFKTKDEALDAACKQVLQSGMRVDILYIWWYYDKYDKAKWAHQTTYEAQEVFEFATGRRTRS